MRGGVAHRRPYFLLTLVYICVHLTHIALSCVLLLNGWTPMSVRERVRLADIAAMGVVLNSWEGEHTSEDGTYSAEFRLLTVYKGHDHLLNVSAAIARGNVYNISNFGSKAQCYADVEVGGRYILFLTPYDGRLSGQYDDLFGAAAAYSEEREEGILDYLGWDEWSPWSSCTAACGEGRRSRSRDCSQGYNGSSACIGVGQESQSCNVFPCQGSHDLLTLMGLPSLPPGVTRTAEPDTGGYVIAENAQLSLAASRVYDVTLPSRFSLVMEFKVHKRSKRRYFFVVSDAAGKQQLAIFLGRRLKFQYLGDNYGFKSDLLDNEYHSVGVSVDGARVTVIVDCETVFTRKLRSVDQHLGTDLLLSIGPYFSEYGKPFVGGVRQLLISEDASIAAQQCGHLLLQGGMEEIGVLETTTATMGTEVDSTLVSPTTAAPPQVFGIEWSPWTPCSATCGQGQQSRQPNCRPNVQSEESCAPSTPLRPQIRQCSLGPCKGCVPDCQNGGICLPGNTCKCLLGFTGPQCETRDCSTRCLNGGTCNSGNGTCNCTDGFSGDLCQTPVCDPACKNGGRCILPGQCLCLHGYSGPSCSYKCSFTCLHGGECVGLNQCRCSRHYTGADCSTPLCKRGCLNGGQCVSPNTCSCPFGYFGKRCQRVRCRPRCKNGGVCVSPDRCLCRSGYSGLRCQIAKCRIKCENGGTCGETNRCRCPPGFFGRRCQKERCSVSCMNGGRCRHSNICRCPPGFSGRRCERRTCTYQHYMVPYRRTYRRIVRESQPVPCGIWSRQMCTRTRLKYVLITRETYRPMYRCV